MGDLKQGDWNKDQTKRFWKYHKPSKNGEWWLTPEKFDQYRLRSKIQCSKSRKENPDTHRNAVKNWRKNNLQKCKEYWKFWSNKNSEKIFNNKSLRRQREKSTTLTNSECLIVKVIVDCRKRISKCIGIPFHVDHIIPLSKGGQHKPFNLQILPAKINQRKHCKIETTTNYG